MASASAYAPKTQTYTRSRQRSFVGSNVNLSVAGAAAMEEVISPKRRYDRETAVPAPKRKAKTVEKVVEKAKPRTETRIKERVQSKNQLKKKAAAIAMVLFFFSMYAVLVSRFSLLSQKTVSAASLKSQITVAQNEVTTLESTLAAKNSVTTIKDKAAEQSMGFSTNNQVVYVDVPADEDDTNNAEDSNENGGIFGSFLQFLGLS